MRYVALLRGINVGGNNKVSMPQLKSVFEEAGMSEVKTYINSGNVLFTSEVKDRGTLVRVLEDAIRTGTGVPADVQLRTAEEIGSLVATLPDEWRNDDSQKCDVVFLQPDVDDAGVLDELGPRPGIEDAIYLPGAVLWRIDRKDASRNRLVRMMGTPLYPRVTVRNCNTVRKLAELLGATS